MKTVATVMTSLVLLASLVSTGFAHGPGSGSDTSTPTAPATSAPAAPSGDTAPSQPDTTTPSQPEATAPQDEKGAAPATPSQPGEADGSDSPGKPEDPASKAKEVLTGLIEQLAAQLPEEAQAIAALETSLQAMTDALIQDGAAQDEADAEATVESHLEGKRSGGAASKAELDLLAHIKLKQGEDTEAEEVMEDMVATDPDDLSAYKALGKLREKLGTDKGIEAFVGGKEVSFDVRPLIKEGRTLVPVRALTEALGAKVSWDPNARAVTVEVNGKQLVLQIDSTTVTIDGQTVTLDVPAQIVDGRTVLPLRFVAEALGLTVDWEAETQTIVVN